MSGKGTCKSTFLPGLYPTCCGWTWSVLQTSQEGCECPCPALLRLCRAGTFTPHLTPAAQVPPMRLEVAVTQIPPWETEQGPSPDGHPGLQTDMQVFRQEGLLFLSSL